MGEETLFSSKGMSLQGVRVWTLLCLCSIASCLSADQTVLMSLSGQLKGSDGSPASDWDTKDSDPCNWEGVECSRGGINNSVTSLSLPGLHLNGIIPSVLGLLQSLTTLDLSNNTLRGPIPPSLANCTSLSVLNLSSNHLTGAIPPDFYKLHHLQVLDLSQNHLNGTIPPELGSLTSLQSLDLAFNDLSGTLPSSLGNLVSLEDLSLSQNSFEGSIPDLSKLSSLQSLSAYQNNFTGLFPVLSFKNLKSVNLASNFFNGSIPQNVCASGQLRVLVLTNNRLQGSLPNALGSCTSLTTLRVGSNSLTGSIPDSFGQLENLIYFEAYQNNLEGLIPSDLGGWKNLSLLNLNQNSLTGSIPVQLTRVNSLQELLLSSNTLTGTIPPGLSQCELLSVLDLSNNLLQGSIPDDLCNVSKLVTLRLDGNSFSGPVPSTIGKCVQLLELQLGDNRLTGSIPPTIGDLLNLQVSLNLSLNQLTGTIPASLRKLSRLVLLDLSHNSLTGEIPPLDGMVSLLDWNFSNNLLSGPVPQIGLSTINSSSSTYASSYANNSGLCGGPLPPCGADASHALSARNAVSVGEIVGIAIAGVIVAVITISGIAYGLMHKHHSASAVDPTPPLTSACIFSSSLEKTINFDSIKEATQRNANAISTNQWSTLYKVVMPSGSVLAAKRLHPREKGLVIQQRKMTFELEKFWRLSHDNIMRPVGYFLENDLILIIYDFVPLCSLGQRLHRSLENLLSWSARFEIAVGAAKGLAFLHHAQSPIMHMDVTSNNIFLGPDLEVKVGDIEVVKLLDPSKNTGSISAVAGSLGYIAPEYAFTMRVTVESNVYSFGVVLLELLTGRRPIDESFGDGLDLVRWVQGASSRGEMPEQILDARISTHSFASRQEMLGVLKVALLCTSAAPLKRPRMKKVLEMLLEAKLPAEAHSPRP